MTKMIRATLPACAMLLLGGCGALNNIYWTQGINDKDGKVFTVDAKQRHLIFNPNIQDGPVEYANGIYYQNGKSSGDGKPEYGNGELQTRWRVCSEPSPDTSAAVSGSLSSGFGLSAEERAKIALAYAETVASIKRTQTVNLLRDSMFQTCMRYLSGALTREEFIIQAARDQRSMLASLAVEQLTGAVEAQGFIISGGQTGSTNANGQINAELVKQYTDTRNEERSEHSTAKTAFDTINDQDGGNLCSKDPIPNDADGQKKVKCLTTKANLDKEKAELDKAQAELDGFFGALGDLADGQSASTGGGTRQFFNPGNNRLGDAAMVEISDNVVKIISGANVDEALMFCVAYLGRPLSQQASAIQTSCSNILLNQARQDLQTKDRLFNLSSDNRSAGRRLRLEYEEFRGRLYALIENTPAAKLNASFKKFQQDAKSGADYADLCIDNYRCAQMVLSRDPFETVYQQHKVEFLNALEAWEQSLS